MEIFFSADTLATLALLIGLELVLGIDNVLLISILTGRLPEADREKARKLGLALALVARLGLLCGVSALQKMTNPVLFSLSIRDIILLSGGLFLIYKAVKEMHHVIEKHAPEQLTPVGGKAALSAAIMQIVILDVVFSIDSVITAVGLTDHLGVIMVAVVGAFVLVLMFATFIAEFVHKNPTLKILALSFLVCIGITLCMESFHHEIPKQLIYLPMGFALLVEFLQLRYDYNRKKHGSN